MPGIDESSVQAYYHAFKHLLCKNKELKEKIRILEGQRAAMVKTLEAQSRFIGDLQVVWDSADLNAETSRQSSNDSSSNDSASSGRYVTPEQDDVIDVVND